WSGVSPRLKHVEVLEQVRKVVLLESPVLLGVQRRPHREHLSIDADQPVEAIRGVESVSVGIIECLRAAIRIYQHDSNRHAPTIGLAVSVAALAAGPHATQDAA